MTPARIVRLRMPDWAKVAASVAWLAMALAALAAIVFARADLEETRSENRCRDELAAAVDEWDARNTQAVGDGLAAYAAGDDAALAAAVERQRATSVELDAAIEAQAAAPDTC